MNFLFTNFNIEERINELKYITDLASEMLSHLIATRNPGGNKTPQESVDPTPDTTRLRQIKDLFDEAITSRSQSALKDLLFLRDGDRCLFTDVPFVPPCYVVPQAAHILPFSLHNKPFTLSAMESFAGGQLAEEVKKNINSPCNAFNAQSDAHDSYDKLAWGIEAIQFGNEWRYFFRQVRSEEISYFIKLRDGQEIVFGREAQGQILDKPNPHYCNLKLAIARVMNACGAADIIAEMYGDDDDDDAIIT